VKARYESYGWQVQVVDWKKTGQYQEDIEELNAAIEAAKAEISKPSMIILRTIIGWPSPGKMNTGKIHGSALGADELAAVKKRARVRPGEDLRGGRRGHRAHQEGARPRSAAHAEWNVGFDAWAEAANPERKQLLDRML
jgi:transketolase